MAAHHPENFFRKKCAINAQAKSEQGDSQGNVKVHDFFMIMDGTGNGKRLSSHKKDSEAFNAAEPSLS